MCGVTAIFRLADIQAAKQLVAYASCVCYVNYVYKVLRSCCKACYSFVGYLQNHMPVFRTELTSSPGFVPAASEWNAPSLWPEIDDTIDVCQLCAVIAVATVCSHFLVEQKGVQ